MSRHLGLFACWILALSACSDDFSSCEERRACHGTEDPTGEAGAGGDGSGGDGAGGTDSGGQAGGGNDGSGDVTLVVTTLELPKGRFNTDYRAQLAATGGESAEYVWTLTGGSLPEGLELDADGTISGVPLSDGDFELEVTVTAGEASGTATLSLTIVRQRWFAYMIADTPENRNRLYVADVTKPDFPSIPLTADVPDTWSVQGFRWAPNGEVLVYWMAEGTAVTSPVNPWVVDFRGEKPVALPPGQDGQLLIRELEWAPDSLWQAVVVVTSVQGSASLYITASGHIPHLVGPAPGTGRNLHWLTRDFLLYRNADSELSYVRRNATGFDEPVSLSIQGDIEEADPGSPALFVRTPGSAHCAAGNTVVDIGADARVTIETPAVAAPKVDRVAIELSAGTATRLEIYPALDHASGALIASLEGATCTSARWSANGELLGWFDDQLRYHVTRFTSEGEAATLMVPHDPLTDTAHPPEFSPDGRWMCFAADQKVHVVRIDGDEIPTPTVVSDPISDGAQIETCDFSPDSKKVLFTTKLSPITASQGYLSDLSSGVPAKAVSSVRELEEGEVLGIPLPETKLSHYELRRTANARGFSPDASTLYYVTIGSERPLRMFLKDLLSSSEPVHIASTNCVDLCSIPSIGFQPYPAD